MSKFPNVTQRGLRSQEPRQAGERKVLQAEQDLTQRWRRGNRLELFMKASSDEEQEEGRNRRRGSRSGDLTGEALEATPGPTQWVSRGLGAVGFPVGTRVGSGDPGKSRPAWRLCANPPPKPASSSEWLKPWAGVCWGDAVRGTLTVKVTGLCLERGPVWQAVSASCIHCASRNQAGPSSRAPPTRRKVERAR